MNTATQPCVGGRSIIGPASSYEYNTCFPYLSLIPKLAGLTRININNS